MRVQNSLKNIIFGLSGQIISSVMGFIVRTVFITTLGIEYLGVEGLFTNVLTILSLANLGFDTAIIYSLYKPLAENNKYQIQALMNLYEKAYRLIGVIVLLIGLLMLPFLSLLIAGETSIRNIRLIYILFLTNTVSSYYFIYKQSIIIADQHNHIISKIHSIFTIISNIMQIMALLTLKNYIIVLSFQIVSRVVENLYIANKANKLYPFINDKNKAKLSNQERNYLFKNLYALMLYKISGVVISGTDNIVISKFVGIMWVGVYSNYFLIISTLNTFISYIFYSLTASIGNLNVKGSQDKKYSLFCVVYFTNFWIYGFCSICLWNMINPFIVFWLGDKYILNKFIVFAILLNFYTTGMQNACTAFRETTGLFIKGKYRPIAAAIINLIVSIILAKVIGIAGVLLGTVVSRLCTYFWYDPYIIYKTIFKRPVRIHFYKYLYFGSLVLILAIICDIVSSAMNNGIIGDIVIRGVLCITVPNIIFYIIFRKSEELKYLLNVVGLFTRRKLYINKEIYN